MGYTILMFNESGQIMDIEVTSKLSVAKKLELEVRPFVWNFGQFVEIKKIEG